MKGFHYHFDFKSHDPGRLLSRHLEMTRHAWEETTHLTLRLLAFALLFEEGLEINGRPLDPDAPYLPSFGKWDLHGKPEIWGECQPDDFKRIKKIASKAPSSNLVLVMSSLKQAETALAALGRMKLRKGRVKILHFEPDLIEEMNRHLSRRNKLTWVQGTWQPPLITLDFNGSWFETSFGILDN